MNETKCGKLVNRVGFDEVETKKIGFISKLLGYHQVLQMLGNAPRQTNS